jgi:methylation protein EvaC
MVMKTNIIQNKIDLPKRKCCRTCGEKISDFLDFGYLPLAGAFIENDYEHVENLYPMQVSYCPKCTLVQIPNVISKETLFNNDYHYLSSVTSTLNRHFEEYSIYLQSLTNKLSDVFVVEFGCNDGVLLSKLNDKNIRNLGIDPSSNVVTVAQNRGLNVICDFINEETANNILKTNPQANVITGSNVFAHNDDIGEILKGVQVLLRDDGYFIIEVHYLLDLLSNLQFDFFYHEHCNYYSLHSIRYLLNLYDLEVVDVQRLKMHSGSIRVISKFKNKASNISNSVLALLELELSSKINSLPTYLDFSKSMEKVRNELSALLSDRKSQGKSICGYGASGRSVTLLNYLGITHETLDFMIDSSPVRANHIMPGLHIPIYFAERSTMEKTDVCLITAWSYAKEILAKEEWYLGLGNEVIIPLPEIESIKHDD